MSDLDVNGLSYASVSLFIKMVKVILITQDYVNKKKTSAGERHLDHI